MPLIVGHIYKILPFLIWYEKFSPLVGKQKVPLLHQMIHTKVADIQTWMLFIALSFLCASVMFVSKIVFVVVGIIVFISIGFVVYNVMYTFTYTHKE